MTRALPSRIVALALGLALLIGSARFAAAQATAIDTAKQAGQIGERYDGYLGVVNSKATADMRSLVDDINAKRREKYAKIAQTNGVSTAQVARIAGAKLLDQTPSGQYVMPREGEWVLK
jgi:uncharacterized protein YdbL (DUF1318 family)